MNQKQLDFVMHKLKIKDPSKKFAISSVIIDGKSAYITEVECDIPKNTLNRIVKRCENKWQELLHDATIMSWVCKEPIVSAES